MHTCLKDDYLCRWPDGAMPIQVYIAPFTWYEKKKQQESLMYRQMVLDSLDLWRKATNNLVRFNMVSNLNQSQIDFKWRRVDRKTLGHCTYEMDNQYRLFSAEVQIGISDGLLHAAYQEASEVKHTILHEIGHALGLIGHSDEANDIMYVPHQFGVYTLSPRDMETIRWLYQLPVGFSHKTVGGKYQLQPGHTINDVINKVEQHLKGERSPEEREPVVEPSPPAATEPPQKPFIRSTRSLDEQHEILSEMGRFYLKTQNIKVNPQKQHELRRAMMEKKLQNRLPPPPLA